jgi:hypothetical protein
LVPDFLKQRTIPARLELYEDKAEFFKGMEDDWQHLVQYGIGREAYEALVAELRGP